MTTTGKLLTGEDLLKLPDDGNRYELLDRVLTKTAPTGGRHGEVEAQIAYVLKLYTAQHGGKVWSGDPGFSLRRNPDRVRSPDVCSFAPGRAPSDQESEAYTDIIPDLIVEVVSPGDTATEVQEKVAEWLAAGARLVLAVYPRPRQVIAFRSLTDIRAYTDNDTLDAEPVLPGFACPAARLFE